MSVSTSSFFMTRSFFSGLEGRESNELFSIHCYELLLRILLFVFRRLSPSLVVSEKDDFT